MRIEMQMKRFSEKLLDVSLSNKRVVYTTRLHHVHLQSLISIREVIGIAMEHGGRRPSSQTSALRIVPDGNRQEVLCAFRRTVIKRAGIG